MDFQPGTFVSFKAITKIHLGAINQDLMPGTVIEYDGSTTRISGVAHNIPSIAGAIRIGWLVPLDDNVSRYVPQPAGIQVRPATSTAQERGQAMKIEPAVDDERQVGTLEDSNARRKAALESQMAAERGPVVRPVEVEPKKYTVVHEESPVEVTYKMGPADRTKPVETDRVDSSHHPDAKPVAQLRPAKMGKIDVSDATAVQAELRALDPVTGTKPEVKKIAAVSRTNEDAVKGTPITQVHTTGATGDAPTTMVGDTLEDLIPEAVSSGKPQPGPIQSSDTLETGQIVWDKAAHWRVRVKTALTKYGNNPNALKQIMEQEDATVARFIREGLAKK